MQYLETFLSVDSNKTTIFQMHLATRKVLHNASKITRFLHYLETFISVGSNETTIFQRHLATKKLLRNSSWRKYLWNRIAQTCPFLIYVPNMSVLEQKDTTCLHESGQTVKQSTFCQYQSSIVCRLGVIPRLCLWRVIGRGICICEHSMS